MAGVWVSMTVNGARQSADRYEPLTRGMRAAMPHVDRPPAGGQLDRLARGAGGADGAGGVRAGLILAAGAGRRFGETKQLAGLRGRPLLEHAIDAMVAVPALDEVWVVLGHAAGEIMRHVDFGAAGVLVCADWERGQAHSLRHGVAALPAAETVVVTLGDQPFVTPEVIAGALAQLGGDDALRTTYGGAPGHPVVLGRRVLDAVGELKGDKGARELLARFRVHEWEAGHLCSAADVDTREELAELARRDG